MKYRIYIETAKQSAKMTDRRRIIMTTTFAVGLKHTINRETQLRLYHVKYNNTKTELHMNAIT